MNCKFDYVLIVGANESGKSTFAKALGEVLAMKVGETSEKIDGPLSRVLASRPGAGIQYPQQMVEWMNIPQHKEPFRAAKKAMADELCRIHASWMVEACVNDGATIIVGMRRASEITAFLDTLPGSKYVALIQVYRGEPGPEIEPLHEFIPVLSRVHFSDEFYNHFADADQLRAAAREYAQAISLPGHG